MDAKVEISPTAEQIDIVDFVRSASANFIINALAGTGKSTTLQLVDKASTKVPILYLVFSKAAAKDAERGGKFSPTTTIRTLNGCGHRVWCKAVPNISLDPKKMQIILKEEINALKGEDRAEASASYFEILSAVGLAKSLGYIPEGKFPHAKRLISTESFHDSLEEKPSEIVSYLIDVVLIASIKAAYEGSIDFNDQIYMPALFGGTFPRFPLVLVDEAQDLNPCNHEMLNKLVKGRLGAVGDPWQSIYGFRGAVQEGMGKIRERFSCQDKNISISFRCPRRIVENARWRVPHYKWLKDGGKVETLRSLSASEIPDGSAIICRNNAPLFRLAFHLLSNKRSVQVAGSDVGPKIIGMLGKLGAPEDTSEDLIVKIEGWRYEKLQTSQAPDTVNDMAECMKIFATFGRTLSQAVAYAKHLFEQQGTIKMLTGHKAKGLEWDIVYHLDEHLIRLDKSEQEKNLRYVIETRAKSELYRIRSDQIQ